jgi:hypothetical protein
VATVTTNFNFPIPQSTDLVKDGATAIAALGTSVDTQFVDLKGGTTGQVLAKASNTDLDYSWVTTDDTNAIQNAIVDAKGDLIAASANDTPARLAVGNNGETLVADSSTSTGLRYQSAYNGNVLINGGFDFFQRGTSSSVAGVTVADRWYNALGGTTTFSQDTSVPTGAGVQYSYKWTTGASSSFGQFYQALESATVKPLRSQSMIFSFWVKTTGTAFVGTLAADAAYSTSTDAYASQTVGVTITGASGITPTGTWTKYSGTLTIPSDATGLKIGLVPTSVQASGVVLYLAACQLELGSVSTTFKRAGGTIQGELAACQYYFQSLGGVSEQSLGSAFAYSTTGAAAFVKFNGQMRGAPTMSIGAGAATDFEVFNSSASDITLTALAFQNPSLIGTRCLVTVASGLTGGNGTELKTANTTARIWASSEL